MDPSNRINFRITAAVFFMGLWFAPIACSDTPAERSDSSPDGEDEASEESDSPPGSDDSPLDDTASSSESDDSSQNPKKIGEFTIEAQTADKEGEDAPGTVGIVTWAVEVESLESAVIEYGVNTDYGMKALADLGDEPYRTLLLGMKPNTEYHFRIVATSADGTIFRSDDQSIETGPATNLVSISDLVVVNESRRERGFIVSSLPIEGKAFILDADGEVVWWYQPKAEGDITRAAISYDAKNLWMIFANNTGVDGSVERVTMDTLESETYDIRGASHDLTPVVDDVVAFINVTNECSQIVEMDPSGNPYVVYDTAEVFAGAACHSNALRYSATENVYTLSDLSHHDLIEVSRDGKLNWRLEEMQNAKFSGYQHGHHLLDNSILIFDNGIPGNDAVVRELSLEDGSELFHYDAGEMTHLFGDVQRLPGGNTLITYSLAGLYREIDPEGSPVMDITFDVAVGYASWRESLYGPPPDILI